MSDTSALACIRESRSGSTRTIGEGGLAQPRVARREQEHRTSPTRQKGAGHAEQVLKSFNTWAFKREQPGNAER
ncbi:hypothetical protein, partial [Methylobacterium crusticola]